MYEQLRCPTDHDKTIAISIAQQTTMTEIKSSTSQRDTHLKEWARLNVSIINIFLRKLEMK